MRDKKLNPKICFDTTVGGGIQPLIDEQGSIVMGQHSHSDNNLLSMWRFFK
jgi:hypothetical protein